ncbi:MAG: EAL domain-containing protein [Acidimicrobiales bacterium]
MIALSMFVVGSLATLWGASVVARNGAQASQRLFVMNSEQISASLKLAIQNEQNLVVNAGAFFIENPHATEADLHNWLVATQTISRYPELAGIAEVVVVTQAQLSSFEAEATLNPAGPLGPHGAFVIVPAGRRPFYCFARVAVSSTGPSTIPAGLDYCDTVLGPEFLKVRDTGQGAYLPYGTGRTEELAIGTPIYSTGYVPATKAARDADFIGWTGTQVYPHVLLAAALAHHPKTAVAFTYQRGSSKVTFRSGSIRAGSHSVTTYLQKGWRVETYEVLNGANIFDSSNALTLLLTGVLLSLLLGTLTYVLATGRRRAITMVHERTDQLQHQALHDSLTGLPNRALIMDRIDRMLSRARRDDVSIAVLYLDLDNFKDINDTLGHAAGDQLLIKVAARLSNVLRTTDSVGRLGGDEFVILAEGSSLAPGAEAVASRILEVLSAPFEIDASDVPLNVSASIGIAEGSRAQPGDLLRDADIALYQAKSAGKNSAVVFLPSMQKSVEDHRTLTTDLSRSVELHQFFLLYEPIIDLATGELMGVEALLRWQQPTRGVVMPEEFMPLLESSGLVVAVGLWMLREACGHGARWQDAGHRFSVSVSLTPRQLSRDRIIDEVRTALAETRFDPANLILEIGETSLMHDVERTIVRLESLKALGVNLAVGDFGTWYSSLAFLQRFPIDILKIDRRFVSGIADTKEASALVHTLVQLGIALGLETVAEGIESHEQRRLLVDERVDTGQGFLFAQPLTASEVDTFLSEWTGEVIKRQD